MELIKNVRIDALDLIKAFAVLLVLADHSGLTLPPVLDYLEVPAFFVVSGMFIGSNRSLWQFAGNRFMRLGVPYVVYALLFVALCWWSMSEVLSVRGFVMAMIQPANYPLWFLKALFWSVVVQHVLIVAGAFARWWLAIVMLIIEVVMAVIISQTPTDTDLWMLAGMPQGAVALPLVSAGYATRRYMWPLIWQPRQWYADASMGVALFALSLIVTHGEIHMHELMLGTDPWLFYPRALLVFVAFMLIAKAVRMPLVARCGRWSLAAFCFHAIPIAMISAVAEINPLAMYVIAVVATGLWITLLLQMRGSKGVERLRRYLL